MKSVAEVLGYNKTHVWLRLPREVFTRVVILTMPRDTLPRGFARARLVDVEVDPKSLVMREELSGFQAKLELLSVREYKDDDPTAGAGARVAPEGAE